MPVKVIDARLRVIPRDTLIYEDVQVGEVQARDVSSHLTMEVTIAIDRGEIDRISKIPEVIASMGKVVAPDVRKYGTTVATSGDWRAKVPEIRKLQWKHRPIIDYIAESYKETALEAVENKFAALSPEWRTALFGPNRENMGYSKDPKALQLSTFSPSDIATAKDQGKSMWPDNTAKWKFVYVEVAINLGDAESGTGFLGQIAKEARQAATAGKIVRADEGQMQWHSSMVGLDSALRELDPYAGTKMSATKIGIYDIADEPGYDIHVREGVLDRIQETLSATLHADISGVDADDRGIFSFTAAHISVEEPTDQDDIAAEMEPEAPELEPEGTPEAPEAGLGETPEMELESASEPKTVKCSDCNGTGDVVRRGGDGERAWVTCPDCGGTGQRKEY
jgi:hypothetical protein